MEKTFSYYLYAFKFTKKMPHQNGQRSFLKMTLLFYLFIFKQGGKMAIKKENLRGFP